MSSELLLILVIIYYSTGILWYILKGHQGVDSLDDAFASSVMVIGVAFLGGFCWLFEVIKESDSE